MIRKTIARILELIPVISAPVSYLLIISGYDSKWIGWAVLITLLLAFLGFAFSLIGRRLARGDRMVRILGVLDWLATIYVIALYVLSFLSIGM